ncbi:MAG: four helix bundle protein [Patescibacteria group bacterium]|nr:four helix bundle protein [Patescibacteria group bacterium]MDD5294613.1 four helix bundle protein [Patescibacteria group bacterium]MDD5555022.1 four helix bundle protein [Patescibacteria group bacterium]
MDFHRELKELMHEYVKYVYKVTKTFPSDELYGITSQLRRAAISVILNYIEGYARRRGENCKVYRNFLGTAYGSLKESEYLVFFSYTENYINENDYKNLSQMADKIGGMLWGIYNKI